MKLAISFIMFFERSDSGFTCIFHECFNIRKLPTKCFLVAIHGQAVKFFLSLDPVSAIDVELNYKELVTHCYIFILSSTIVDLKNVFKAQLI